MMIKRHRFIKQKTYIPFFFSFFFLEEHMHAFYIYFQKDTQRKICSDHH